MNDPTLDRYLNGDYAEKNSDWDAADAPWKATKISQLLHDHGYRPDSFVEIGTGSGAILSSLRAIFPEAAITGFDIAPGAQRFWQQRSTQSIRFALGDYLDMDEPAPDVVLLIDVLEHLGNPWEFLARLRGRCKLTVFHIPLDLSAASVLSEVPLLSVHNKVGHLHYFTKGLALAMLEECGFEVIEARYTGAAFSAPKRAEARLKTYLAGLLRRITFAAFGDVAVRLFGGETLMVLARPRGVT